MSSTSYSSKVLALFVIASVFISGSAPGQKPPGKHTIAVLPVENLSGKPAPLKEIRQKLISSLKNQLVPEEEALNDFMAKHRLRYTGGIDTTISKALKEELGADSVLITSLELYDQDYPPKIALISRLVATGEAPVILWMDSTGMAGDDSPGILGMGLIKDPHALAGSAVSRLANSINKYLSGVMETSYDIKTKKKFSPRFYYRSPLLDPGERYTLAVAPFFNESPRRNAETFVMLHFVKEIYRLKNFSVIEPGVLRQSLLEHRFIMEEGISLAQTDDIFSSLDVDLVLSGKVLDYEDYRGPEGKPKVDFSLIIVERNTREVIWSSKSYAEGDKEVILFNLGKINTAHALASEMVKGVSAKIAK